VKVGDLVKTDGLLATSPPEYGVIARLPYDISSSGQGWEFNARCIDVLWFGSEKPSRVDYSAIENGSVEVVI